MAVAPRVVAGEGGGFGDTGANRGDNPVVGSLPCLVLPTLNQAFWIPLGKPPPPPGVLLGFPTTLGVVGPVELQNVLVTAGGEPYGGLNGGTGGWNCLGLSTAAEVTLWRDPMRRGEATLWQYLPEGYVGGEMRTITSSGCTKMPIQGTCTALQSAALAGLPACSALITVEFVPPAGRSTLKTKTVEIVLTGSTFTARYRP